MKQFSAKLLAEKVLSGRREKKMSQARLAEAGFNVIEENVRSQWNPEESDLAGIPALVTALIGQTTGEA